jgi:hypothetical protein
VTWFLGIRKLNAEIREIKTRTARTEAELLEIKHRHAVEDAALTLFKRGNILREQSVNPCLSRASWASFLAEPNLVDEALKIAGATHVPGEGDLWIIPSNPIGEVERWK